MPSNISRTFEGERLTSFNSYDTNTFVFPVELEPNPAQKYYACTPLKIAFSPAFDVNKDSSFFIQNIYPVQSIITSLIIFILSDHLLTRIYTSCETFEALETKKPKMIK